MFKRGMDFIFGRPKRPKIITNVPGRPPIELVDYYDEFLWYYPQCELATKEWFVNRVQEDWCILDIGANIGYYSILFSQLAPRGHVYAIEPDATTLEKLRRNLKHHEVQNVTVLNYAVGKATGMIEDNIYNLWGTPPSRKSYPFITVDALVKEKALNRIDAIKIDVDSFDFDVLQGARETLVQHNPCVVVELNHALDLRQESNTKAIRWMAGLGYADAMVLGYDNFAFKRGADPGQAAASITLHFPPD